MKPKTIVLMIVAVGFGLVAAWATTRIGAVPQTETVDVLVATKDIAPGSSLKDPQAFFKAKPFLKDQAPKNAINDIGQLKGKMVIKPIKADTFCTAADLGEKYGLEVSKGMRAIAVPVTSAAVAGGFVLPNSRVDVVLTSREGGNLPKAETILQNMRVLAVDAISRTEAGKDSYVPTTVTLEMSPDEALKLASAKDRGRIELVLRPFEDAESTPGSTAGSGPPQLQTEEVWVAAKRLDKNTKLEDVEGLLKKKRFIKEEVPTNAINNRELLKNKTLSRVVEADQFFTEEDFKEILKPEVVGTPPPPKKHIMIIVNGGKTDTATFVEGAVPEGGQGNENRISPPGGDPDKRTTPPAGGSEGK